MPINEPVRASGAGLKPGSERDLWGIVISHHSGNCSCAVFSFSKGHEGLKRPVTQKTQALLMSSDLRSALSWVRVASLAV